MATKVSPFTPYITKPVRSSLKISALSLRYTSDAAADRCAEIARAAASRSASVGSSASCGAGRIRRASAKKNTTAAAPTAPRRKREASPCNANCHHKSGEYSTCLKAKNPSHSDDAMAAATAEIQAAEKRVSRSAAFRSNAGRARTSTSSNSARSVASSKPAPLSSDAAMPRPTANTDRKYATSSRRARPCERSSSAAPTRLPMKCEVSMTPSGTKRPRALSRSSAVGVAPEKSSTSPPRNVNTESRRGENSSDSLPRKAVARSACDRRWCTSSATSATSATASGSR